MQVGEGRWEGGQGRKERERGKRGRGENREGGSGVQCLSSIERERGLINIAGGTLALGDGECWEQHGRKGKGEFERKQGNRKTTG